MKGKDNTIVYEKIVKISSSAAAAAAACS